MRTLGRLGEQVCWGLGALLLLGIVAHAAGNSEQAQRYVDFCRAGRAEALRPDACPFSPAAVVMRVGTQPQKLAQFIKDRVAYEPSFGIVRGAEGTLAAQAGGDWDRANLLKAVLAEAGYAAEFRVVQRTDAQAQAVVDAWLKGATPLAVLFGGGEAAKSVLHPAGDLLRRFGIPLRNIEMQQAREQARWRGILDEAFDAAAVQTPWIEKMLADGGQKAQAFEAWRAQLIAAARQRVVLKLAGGGMILDVSPDAAPLTEGEVNAASGMSQPPKEVLATVAVQLLMSVSGQDSAHPIVLLSRTMPLGGLFRQPIRLEIVPGDAAASAKPAATWTTADWYGFVSGFKTFQAIVHVGQQSQASQAFDLEGNVHQVDSDGRIAGAKQMGGAVMGGFGSALGGGDEEQTPKTHIESLVMRLTLTLPGEKPLVRQRMIYGTLRPGMSPVYTADMLVSGGPVGAGSMAWMLTDAVTHNAPILAALWSSDDPARFGDIGQPMRMPVMLYQWQYGRAALADRLLKEQSSLTAVGEPSIVLHTTQLRVDDKARMIWRRAAVDVVCDGLRIVPRSESAVAAAVRANINGGVGATVLESVLLRRIDPSASLKGVYAVSEDGRAGGQAALLTSAEAVMTNAKPSALVQWALATNPEQGVLLFPIAGRPDAWWCINPATGQTIGRGDGGEGQSAMEYLQVLKMNLSNLKCMLSFAGSFVGGANSASTAAAWMACVTGADNPGSYVGAVGNVQDIFGVGGGLAACGDILGGAWDISQL